jgi:hypothetical protein
LPDDLLSRILARTGGTDIARAACACRALRRVQRLAAAQRLGPALADLLSTYKEPACALQKLKDCALLHTTPLGMLSPSSSEGDLALLATLLEARGASLRRRVHARQLLEHSRGRGRPPGIGDQEALQAAERGEHGALAARGWWPEGADAPCNLRLVALALSRGEPVAELLDHLRGLQAPTDVARPAGTH